MPNESSNTAELIKRAKNLTLKEALKMEFQVCQHMIYRNDFNEGVNNILVNKQNNAKWNPSKINDINLDEVNSFFIPHIEDLNI